MPATLVHDIDLASARSEFVAITGPSGSGKSSLLYLLGLLDLPTAGEVRIRGRATAHMDEAERAQRPAVDARVRVPVPLPAAGVLGAGQRDAADEGAGRAAAGGDARARQLRCWPRSASPSTRTKRPDQLSGGQRQRVAVARALANDPPVILADEPTGSLDSKSSEQVFQILRELVDQRGKTVVAVTHDLDLARRMDRRIGLQDGSIVSDEAGSR